MQAFSTIALLTVYMLLKTADVVWLKRAQPRAGSVWQNLLFACVFCVFQALMLLILPPYEPMYLGWELWLLPSLFALFYLGRTIGMVKALDTGPTSLSQILISFNTLFPVIGAAILGSEPLRWWQVIGLVLFCIALPLFNSGSYQEGTEKKPITLRWMGWALASLCFSGFAVCCTKLHCARFDGTYIKEYLFLYAVVCAVITLPFVLFAWKRGLGEMSYPRARLGYTALSAFSLDAANIIFMLFIGSFSSAFYFPLVSVISVLGVLFAGRIFLKERVNRRALLGIALSAAALALLAIS